MKNFTNSTFIFIGASNNTARIYYFLREISRKTKDYNTHFDRSGLYRRREKSKNIPKIGRLCANKDSPHMQTFEEICEIKTGRPTENRIKVEYLTCNRA